MSDRRIVKRTHGPGGIMMMLPVAEVFRELAPYAEWTDAAPHRALDLDELTAELKRDRHRYSRQCERRRAMSIGIAGLGTVGGAVYANLTKEAAERAVVYDPPKGHSGPGLRGCDIIFCCLPTPMDEDGRQDTAAIDDLCAFLGELWVGLLVIKSTVLPGAELETPHRTVYNPEFLSARTAVEDFERQDTIILGGDAADCAAVRECYRTCFITGADIDYIFTTRERACQLKYSHNVYHALKVLFWNYVQEMSGGAEREIWEMYSEVTGASEGCEMARICADGLPGYGGACFPKDVAAIDAAYPHELTAMMRRYNARLRGGK